MRYRYGYDRPSKKGKIILNCALGAAAIILLVIDILLLS